MPFETIFIGNESSYLEVLKSQSNLRLVVCKPIRGNARKFFGSAEEFARENDIPVSSPELFIGKPVTADIIVVAGHSKRIPSKVIRSPRIAIVNIHQSLLPTYRGRHPLNWAIINGEKVAGVTIHHVNERFDDGKIILQAKTVIAVNDAVMDVHRKTVAKGCDLLRHLFSLVGKKEFDGYQQDSRRATYHPPRTPRDGKINWNEPANKIRNMVRALAYPYPGAYFYHSGRKWIIEESVVEKSGPDESLTGKPVFLNDACFVKTGSEFIRITKLRNRSIAGLADNGSNSLKLMASLGK